MPLTDWTPTTERLTLLADLIGELIAITAAVNSKDGKVQHPTPLPRPSRAIDRVIAEVTDSLYDSLLADIAQAQGSEVDGGL